MFEGTVRSIKSVTLVDADLSISVAEVGVVVMVVGMLLDAVVVIIKLLLCVVVLVVETRVII